MVIRIAFFSLFCFSFFHAPVTANQPTQSIASIDEQIKLLKIKQKRCEMAKKEASDRADRFLNGNDWLSYRKQVAIQIEMEYQIDEIKEKIAVLETQKEQ